MVLHAAVVTEIIHIAGHPTRLTELIRLATAALPAPGDLKAELSANEKAIRESKRKAAAVAVAVETAAMKGLGLKSLIERLAEHETETARLIEAKGKIEERGQALIGTRPDTAAIAAL